MVKKKYITKKPLIPKWKSKCLTDKTEIHPYHSEKYIRKT